MGTSLTGTKPKDTYDSLIKVGDNGPISGTAKTLSDGLGNDLPISVSTSNVGIGTSSPAVKLVVNSTVNTPIFQVLRDNGTNGELSISFPSQQATFNSAVNDMVFQTVGFERARFTANGLTFNGDTAAANALDDYEEGTWNPTISFGGASVGVTYAGGTAGRYTKIGRQVSVTCYILLTSKGSSTGKASIEGLPFAISGGSGFYSAPSFGALSAITYVGMLQGYGEVGTGRVDLVEITEAGVQTVISDADFDNTTQIVMQFTYFV